MKHEDEVRSIIRHALGVTAPVMDRPRGNERKPFRRHYCHDVTPALTEAVKAGLMSGPHAAAWAVAPYWYVTEAGVAFVGEDLPA